MTRTRASAASYTPAPVKPGGFAPKGEKELFKGVQRADVASMVPQVRAHGRADD